VNDLLDTPDRQSGTLCYMSSRAVATVFNGQLQPYYFNTAFHLQFTSANRHKRWLGQWYVC